MQKISKKIQPIVEAYPCLQSEGKLTGIPHLLIRTTGCTLRCQFSDTDFCDSWYTSWSPDKGTFSLDRIITLYKENPQIKHTMITGGNPMMNEYLLHDLIHIAKSFDHYVTIETEGSLYVKTMADFISLSPKGMNSRPRVGTKDPTGKLVTERHLVNHEKNRANWDVMEKMIINHPDYQLKPVISSEKDMIEVRDLQVRLNVPDNKVWLMPSGSTAAELGEKRVWLMEYAWANGYNYTDRIHIVAYGTKRGV